jgi:myo-inositol-1(or 4)-monophosphatase
MIDGNPPSGTPLLARELAVATRLATEAGEILLRHRREGVLAGSKQGGEIVTAADLEVDRAIRAGLAGAFPGDAILSEEAPDHPRRLGERRIWIVDPIDGTQDFADGGEDHGISIGLAIDGRAVLGVVHNPARQELFAGGGGLGLTLGGAPATATSARRVADARLTVSGTEWGAGAYRGLSGLRTRPISSAAYKLARVAAGLDDGTFWAWPRKEWDVCAGVALVLAGGGVVSLLDGRSIAFNQRDVRLAGGLVAAGPALHGPLRRELVRQGLASRDQV